MTKTGTPPDLYAGYETWKGWTETFAFTAEEAEYFAGETRGVKIADADLLEIGFGAGRFLAWAHAEGARVAGTEINAALLEAARASGVEIVPPNIENQAHDHRERFDTIVAFDVFEHFSLAEIIARLGAAETMLKPGGHLLLRFPNGQSPFGLAPQNGDPTHKAALSRGIFEQLIQGTSLRVIRYAASHRIAGPSGGKRLARALRGALRDAISTALNWIYAQDIPWDPVVVLALEKTR